MEIYVDVSKKVAQILKIPSYSGTAEGSTELAFMVEYCFIHDVPIKVDGLNWSILADVDLCNVIPDSMWDDEKLHEGTVKKFIQDYLESERWSKMYELLKLQAKAKFLLNLRRLKR